MTYVPRSLALCAAGVLVWACEPSAHRPEPQASARGPSIDLYDPATAIGDAWQHLQLRGKSNYTIAVAGGRIAIRASADNSASGLIRRIDIDPMRCRHIEWSWRVDRVQPSADIRVKDREDVAASIFLLFGDPGFLSDPVAVPTLRYVWTNHRVRREAVIENPYMKDAVHSLVVRNEAHMTGRWVTERRDLRADYRRAFGADPEAPISAVAIFTDNDQTREPVTAFYGRARVFCDR
jgi:hypothetical protein